MPWNEGPREWGAGHPARCPLVLERPVTSAESLIRLGALAVVLVAAYWLVDMLVLASEPPAWDAAVLEAVVARRTSAAITAGRVFTFLGDLWVVALAGVMMVIVARRRSGRWDLGWLAAAVVGGVLAVTSVVKLITVRPRPGEALVGTISHAFPSGHASRAAAVFALIAWLGLRWGRRPVVRLWVGLASTAMATAIGVSRVALGAHWPTDVVAGWLLGIVWFVGCLAATRPQRPDAGDSASTLPE